MRYDKAGDRVILLSLYAGIAVPFFYYGIQLLAAPYLPGFSLVSTTASELGSDLSRFRSIFNIGIMILGVVTLIASVSFLLAFRRLGIHPLLAWTASLAVAMSGVQNLWAGCFPIPDPRHAGYPAFIIPMLFLLPLLTAALWRQGARSYFIGTLILLACMATLRSGMSLDVHAPVVRMS